MNNRKDKCMHGYDVDEYGNHLAVSPEPKSRSTAELIEEAKKIISRDEPVAIKPEPVKQQTRPINEVRKFNELINNKSGPNENQTQPKGNEVRKFDKLLKGI